MRIFRNSIAIFVLGSSLLLLSSCSLGNRATPAVALGSCNLESIQGGILGKDGTYSTSISTPDIVFQGWIGNDLAGESPVEATVSISGATGNVISYESGSTSTRPDVATFFKKPGMAKSGFRILIRNVQKPGKYLIHLQGKYETGIVLCPRTFTLVVS
jgi:hypothetical protein